VPNSSLQSPNSALDAQLLTELAELSHKIIADGQVNKAEFHHLRLWVYEALTQCQNSELKALLHHIEEIEEDDIIEASELDELFHALTTLTNALPQSSR
jgi:uncharacterized tellurite resistance protein B-like protein